MVGIVLEVQGTIEGIELRQVGGNDCIAVYSADLRSLRRFHVPLRSFYVRPFYPLLQEYSSMASLPEQGVHLRCIMTSPTKGILWLLFLCVDWLQRQPFMFGLFLKKCAIGCIPAAM